MKKTLLALLLILFGRAQQSSGSDCPTAKDPA